jgi:hypothetical protein
MPPLFVIRKGVERFLQACNLAKESMWGGFGRFYAVAGVEM